MSVKKLRYQLDKLEGRRTGWPAGTLAVYGPNDERATKMVAAIVPEPQPTPSR